MKLNLHFKMTSAKAEWNKTGVSPVISSQVIKLKRYLHNACDLRLFLSHWYVKSRKHSICPEKVLNKIPEDLSHFLSTNREHSERKRRAERSVGPLYRRGRKLKMFVCLMMTALKITVMSAMSF